jgi:hypothetical protein
MDKHILTAEETRQLIIEAATPIDFEALIAKGLIVKDGAWYRVPDLKALPKDVSRKIKTVEPGPTGPRVKFQAVTKRAINLAKRLK